MSITTPTSTGGLPAAGPGFIFHLLIVVGAALVAGAVKLARVLRVHA